VALNNIPRTALTISLKEIQVIQQCGKLNKNVKTKLPKYHTEG